MTIRTRGKALKSFLVKIIACLSLVMFVVSARLALAAEKEQQASVMVAKGRKLPNQGGFRNGQAMWDWLGGAGEIWWDGGSPIYSLKNVNEFVNGENVDAMKCPRPKKVKLYMQGHVPRLPKFTYAQAAANAEEFRKAWVAIAKICVEAGYRDCVFGSSETQTKSKPWMPSAEDLKSGRWKRAWINMVDAVRSVMPEARFAFVPLSGALGGGRAEPDNGVLEKDAWYVSEKDKASRPCMDFWGATLYFSTHAANCTANADCPVTKEVIDTCMAVIRTPVADCHTNWGYMGHYQYAREKGVKMVIGEIGLFDRVKGKRPNGMGDQPYAIDKLTELMSDHADQIEFVCWFNYRNGDPSQHLWSCLDAESSMPTAARRVRELWGPDSPYRR